MKQLTLKTMLLVTALTTSAAVTLGDQKNPRGGSSNRVSSSQGSSKPSGTTFRGQNNPGNGNSQFSGGNKVSQGKPLDARVTTPRPSFPAHNNGNTTVVGNGSQPGENKLGTPIVRRPGSFTLPGKVTTPGKVAVPNLGNGGHSNNGSKGNVAVVGNGLAGIKRPLNPGGVTKSPGLNLIQLGNGKTAKPIALNPGLLLQSTVKAPNLQAQVQQIVAKAPKHLCGHSHFRWWVTVCHHHCHTYYGCWNVDAEYWDCWTPCNWTVVQHQQVSWCVGMSCLYIPEMQAYAVESIVDGSPAQYAGLVPGDLILTVNGQSIFDPQLINAEVGNGRLELTFVREGFESPLTTTILPQLVTTIMN